MSFKIKLIFGLIIGLLVAFLAQQNVQPVSVQFFFYQWTTSLSIVIFGAAALGGLLVGLLTLFQDFGALSRSRALQGDLERVRGELAATQKRLAETAPPPSDGEGSPAKEPPSLRSGADPSG